MTRQSHASTNFTRLGLLAWVLISFLRTAAPTIGADLSLRREGPGAFVLETAAGMGDVVLEETASLTPPIQWQPAAVGADGQVSAGAVARFFRWRRATLMQDSAEVLVPLSLEGLPPETFPRQQLRLSLSDSGLTEWKVVWRVEGIVGGSEKDGWINAQGVYTAPILESGRYVKISAEVSLGEGRVGWAEALLWVRGAEPSTGPRPLHPANGGVIQGIDGRGVLEVPPGATKEEHRWSIEVLPPGRLVEFDTTTASVMAIVTLEPHGVPFDSPVRVRLPLDRWMPPGGMLPLFVMDDAGQWTASGFSAVIAADGFTAVAELNHFSRWAVFEPRVSTPVEPASPRIDALTPVTLREGELRPFLVKGSGLERVSRVTVHEDPSTSPWGSSRLEVREFVLHTSAPGVMGVLIKSFPDPTLAGGVSRHYRLRFAVNAAVFTEVPFTVSGLDELELGANEVRVIGADPATNLMTFSRIEIAEGARLESLARVLALQATDIVRLSGTMTAAGPHGRHANGSQPGLMLEPDRSRTGAGDGRVASSLPPPNTLRAHGVPHRSLDTNEYVPPSLAHTYGEAGENGHDGGESLAERVLPAVDEHMYALYDSTYVAALERSSPWNFGVSRSVAWDLVQGHPGGWKGHQGMPGGYLPLGPRYGFHVGQRRIGPGGGGGGGGASFRAASFVNDSVGVIGLGGGSGGGGGGAISVAAGAVLSVGSAAIVDSSGGNGGDGGLPGTLGTPSDLWPLLGRGGGGGPGGGGTIHLLAGERLDNPSRNWPARHFAGEWGRGGFLMTVHSHRQLNPPSWLAPFAEVPGSGQAELAGPDFSNTGRGIRTGIRLNRTLEAQVLNPRFQPGYIRIFNRIGEQLVRVRGASAGLRNVRCLLQPGTNFIQVTDLSEHSVLNREILVLDAPDSDGDGLTDAEETALGFNPQLSDTDGDGMSDSEEWLNGGRGVPGDSDGDGVPDTVEESVGSDPHDPSSTPWSVNLGTGSALAMVLSTPASVSAVRPFFRPTEALGYGITQASPHDTRAVRPSVDLPTGAVLKYIPATPRQITVVWE